MQGTIVKVAVSVGDVVAAGDLVVVLEAMKMEQPINAHRGGTIRDLSAVVGDVVSSGALLCIISAADDPDGPPAAEPGS
jgi:acetyl-CoA/propionyl-CoA carboxylase biotin carboxyl carrier protein